MVIATIFVSLPFVVREVAPVLREIGDRAGAGGGGARRAAYQTFWRVTLPAIRWGVAYGVVLDDGARLGEFGAVSVVSGRIAGKTETLTLHVQERFERSTYVAAYGASVVLAMLAIATLRPMNLFNAARRCTR